jgi:hypothetical protein
MEFGNTLLVVAPVMLTLLLFVAQLVVTLRKQRDAVAGRPTGARAGHAWGPLLLAYMVVTVLIVALSSGFSNNSLGY